MVIGDLPLWFVRGVAIALGLIWGSFLNVVIYRLPRDISVVTPPSHCPGCGAPVKAYLNLPVVSYILLRGRAACCGVKMSPRYPIVETIGGALALAIVEVIIRPLSFDTSIGHAAAIFTADFALALGLVAAAFIDAEHMFLPDSITIGGTILGIATATLRGHRLLDSIIAAAIGFVGIWIPFDVIYKRLRGRSGMGMGDAKLMALIGAWFGIPGMVFALFGGAIQSVVVIGVIYLVKGKIEEPAAVKAEREVLERAAVEGDAEAKEILENDPVLANAAGGLAIPFGPFLILAAIEFLFAGSAILDRFWTLTGRNFG
jgi:leader peptidase (prepilin peptidase)/N-methyltransferase